MQCYQDESGHGSVWAFILAIPGDAAQLVEPIKAWRKEFYTNRDQKGKSRNSVPEEYKDANSSADQRLTVLTKLAQMDVRVFAIIKEDYDPSWEYPYVIADLLGLAGVSETDSVYLDQKDTQKRRAQDHKQIREALKMPNLSISSLDSRVFKEIQACDALAGGVLRFISKIRLRATISEMSLTL